MSNIKTKIIATLGPASCSRLMISQLIREGMNVARINMSHLQTIEQFQETIKIVREEAVKQNEYIGILVDLAGPKIRLDLEHLENGSISLEKNKEYSLGFSSENNLKIKILYYKK